MVLPRKFLNDDEELLAELRPHWIFMFGPLFTSIGVWAAIIALVIVWHNPPGWTNYPLLLIALIPGLWLLGRFLRWRSYIIALTSTRILVRQGITGRDTVQLRLQRVAEVNVSQTLIERVLGTGRVIIDVQGEDDSLTLDFVRRPVVVQRVINSQINEVVGGGSREPIPTYMRPTDAGHRRTGRYEDADDGDRYDDHDDRYDYHDDRHDDHDDRHEDYENRYDQHEVDTPPLGITDPTDLNSAEGSAPKAVPPGTPFEIRDRLIELDDLRRRGILTEEEFASKKSELLDRI
jgi:membrane protein YdbS with pleckstrin-like domain